MDVSYYRISHKISIIISCSVLVFQAPPHATLMIQPPLHATLVIQAPPHATLINTVSLLPIIVLERIFTLKFLELQRNGYTLQWLHKWYFSIQLQQTYKYQSGNYRAVTKYSLSDLLSKKISMRVFCSINIIVKHSKLKSHSHQAPKS